MSRPREQGPQKPLAPNALAVLLALWQSPLHGYAILKELEAPAGSPISLGAGSLYRLIKQFLSDGWIRPADGCDDGGDPRRRYYQLTNRGRVIVVAELDRMKRLVHSARKLNVRAGA